MIGSALDRSQPPLPGTLRDISFPSFTSSQLACGLHLKVMPVDRFPITTLQLMVPAGSQQNPLDRPGLADLHGDLLTEGSTRRSGAELALAIEALGGQLTSGAGWNMAYVEVASLLSSHLPAGLELLAEAALMPRFAEDQVERLLDEHRVELLRRLSRPKALADDVFSEVVYGGTVYGFCAGGTTASLDALGRGEILDFYRQHVGPEGSCLIAVGDIDPDDLHRRAEEHFGDWPAAQANAHGAVTIEPTPLERTEVHLVDRPGSAQTQLQLGHASVPRKHQDFEPLVLLNALFGGKFTSRLNLNLRERNGFTYGANSSFVRRRGPGPFMVRTAVATDVAGAAVGEILSELDRVRDEPVTGEELSETLDYMLGVFPYTLQSIGDLAARLESLVVFELPDDHFTRFPASLRNVTPEDVHRAAREHLHPDRTAIVAVGPAEQLEPQLEKFGPVTVHAPAS